MENTERSICIFILNESKYQLAYFVNPGFHLTFSVPINNFIRIENSNKIVERAFDRVVRLKSHVNPVRSDMQPVSIKTLIQRRVGHCFSDVATLRDLGLFVLFSQGSLLGPTYFSIGIPFL